MNPKTFAPKKGPEYYIQQKIIAKLRMLGWFVKSTHGNMFQSGFPDLFCCHTRYGQRWVEVKNPEAYSFTPAQLEDFPKFCANGSGIWVLTSDSDVEINKLFKSPNWIFYLKW